MAQKTILVITDGIGYNESSESNAFAAAKKPTYDWLFKNVPNTLIKTSGLAVGLPDGQMGNLYRRRAQRAYHNTNPTPDRKT